MTPWTAVLAIISATISTAAGAELQRHHHIPLKQYKNLVKATPEATHGSSKYVARSGEDTATSPLDFNPRHFWYGNLDVGESKNLSLQIDTASGTIIINPDAYKPSDRSVNVNESFDFDFGTWHKDGCKSADLRSEVYRDNVTLFGLTVENQVFASLVDSPPKGYTKRFPNDGIFGTSIGTDLERVGFLDRLCNSGTIDECRYGLAFGTAGVGSMVVGSLDDSLFEGNLTKVPLNGYHANVVVNGTKTLLPKRYMHNFDCGTATIIVPPDDARAIFDAVGIQTMEQPPGWNGDCQHPVTVGYYPCDNPPTIGLQFNTPGASDSGDVNGPVFNIEPEALKLADNGDNNCTATITGWGGAGWNVGQAWFQGKYIDCQGNNGVLSGVATLKDKTGGVLLA